jgi:hypothetical protein
MDPNENARTVRELITSIVEGEQTVFKVAGDLADGAQSLTVDRRKLLPEAPRRDELADTPARAHTFFEPAGFVAYLKKYGGGKTVIYADPVRRMAEAVLTEGQGQGGAEIVSLVPQISPYWQPWSALLGKALPLAALVEFLRENRRIIVEPEGRELVLALSQVTAASNIELQQGSGRNSVNGLMVRTKIQGVDNTALVDLPETIVVRCPIFVGLFEERIELDLILRVVDGGESIAAGFASADIRVAEIRAFERMVADLTDVDQFAALVTLGRTGYRPWEVLR